jgi:WD40 repeat protein
MYLRRAALIVVFGLAAFMPWLAAAEPQPGKLRLVHSLRNPDLVLADRVFSTDGRLLIVKNNHDGSHSVYVWDPKTGKVIARCSLGSQSAYNIAFSPDGKTVACSYHMAKEICLFDIASEKLISRIAQPGYVSRARFAPDGRTLISLSDGMRLWDG